MEKTNSSTTDYVSLVLTGIAGVAGILAATSPLFSAEGLLTNLFVDTTSLKFSSIIALVALVLNLWFFTSLGGFIVFAKANSLEVLEKLRFRTIIMFIISSIIFYSIKLLYTDLQISYSFAAILQMISYVSSFMFLTTSIGITIYGSISSYNNKIINNTRGDRIIQALIKSNIISTKVKILSILPHNSPAPEMQWTYVVLLEITENNDPKEYLALFYGDFTRMISFEERKPQQTQSNFAPPTTII